MFFKQHNYKCEYLVRLRFLYKRQVADNIM